MPALKATLFDIDGTVAPTASWLDLTKGLGASVERHQEIFQAFLAREIDYPESKVQLLGLWHSTGHANKQDMTRIFSAWQLAPGAEECVAVGDSDNDVKLFQATQHGVLIARTDPPAELVPHAWRTIRTLSELETLL